MGSSSKKKKDKDREKDKDVERVKSRKRKHKSKSRSPTSPSHSLAKISKKDKSHKKHKEKRKHSESEDSDIPLVKTVKLVDHSRSASPGEIRDEPSPPRVSHSKKSPSPLRQAHSRKSPSPVRVSHSRKSSSPARVSHSRKSQSPARVSHSRKSPSPVRLSHSRKSSTPPRQSYSRRSPSPPPKSSSGGGDVSLSIDETNKLRIKLGLKPLQTSSAPPPTAPRPILDEELEDGQELDEETLLKIREEREKEADTFWKEKKEFVHAPAENLGQKLQAEKIREKILRVREKRKLEERLAGVKALAEDSDDELDDAAKWIERQKRAAEQKARAEKTAKALAELDDEFGVGDLIEQDFQKKRNNAYSAKDLRGIKVLHSQERLEAGSSVIMTLRDKGVLDEDDDALVNVNMVDDEKFEKNVETRKLRPELHGYNAYDEIEFDVDGNLKEKGVLSKYDEEIDKSSGIKSFKIGDDVSEDLRKAKIREKMQKTNKILESLEGSTTRIASDFYTPEEMVSFKKPKRRVKKVRKVLRADDILKLDADYGVPSTSRSKAQDMGSRGRKDADSKHRRSSHNEDEDAIVKQEPVDMEIDLDIDDLPPQPPSMDDIWTVNVNDEADLDFQLALNKARKLKQKKEVKLTAESIVDKLETVSDERSGSESGSMVLHATAEFCRTLGDIPTDEGVDIYGDEEMDFEQEERTNTVKAEERGRWAEVEIDETPVDITREPDVEEAPILEQEPTVGTGLAGALKLATKKGYLELEQTKRGITGGKMKHLQAQNYSIEDKNYEDDRVHKRDMYSGPTTDFKEKDGYKPEVKLDYVDEDGKTISSKEAFRLLSHKFHGKGSGKNKIDKKRRKVEQDKLMQHMNSTDTPLGTLELLQQKQKETQSPYIVLTGKAQHASLAKSKR